MHLEKPQLASRWLILLFACLLMTGNYYSYDNPSALHAQMSERFVNETSATGASMSSSEFEVNFNLLYTFYSLPNVILPLFGGIITDKFGSSKLIMVFISIIALGQALVSVGVSMESMPVTLAGRLVFGLGGESLSAAMSTILAEWFKGKELAFAMGVQLSISRLGSVINDNLSPIIASKYGIEYAFWFGFTLLLLSVLCSVTIFLIDYKSVNYLRTLDHKQARPLLERTETQVKDAEGIKFSDIKHFSKGFWLITFSCVIVYGCILPFNNIAQSFLIEKVYCAPLGNCCPDGPAHCDHFNDSTEQAGRIMGIPFIISAFSAPFLGGLVDKIGNRALFITCSSALLIAVHLSLWLMPENTPWIAYIPLVLQGCAYSVYAAALWPSIPFVVEEHHIGTAYGLATAVQNIGLASFPIIVAGIYHLVGSYANVEPFFATLGVIGTLSGIALIIWDRNNGGNLKSAEYIPVVNSFDSDALLFAQEGLISGQSRKDSGV